MSKESIGPKIRQFRKRKKLTQEALAKALGYSHKSVITHIEKGESEMSYEKILLFLRTYAVDANELFDAENNDNGLEGLRMRLRRGRGVVVYIHGLCGSHKEAKDYSFFGDDIDVVGLEYKDGNPWEVKEAIRSEFEKITKGYDGVVVIANSIGAFYAYQYLSDFDIQHAFFISPVADMHQLVLNIMKSNGISLEELKKEKAIKIDEKTTLSYDFLKEIEARKDQWAVPTDILYGEKDQLVSVENIVSFLAKHPDARLTIKERAEHYFHTEEEKEFIKNWILRSLD